MTTSISPQTIFESASKVPFAAELLVSVRSLQEAEMVATAGASIIDFKEPSLGALAPVSVQIWEEATRRLGEYSLSAALGEHGTAEQLASRVPPSFRFAKMGPSDLESIHELTRLWGRLAIPNTVELVPVAYVDHDNAKCPDVGTILEAVIAENRTRLLIDTFRKDGRGLRDHACDRDLSAWLTRARQAGVWIAFAGSLQLNQVMKLTKQNLVPNCWGVRGDVCGGEATSDRRERMIDPIRVQKWVAEIRDRRSSTC